MKKISLTFILFLALLCSAFAQHDNFYIHGLIRDRETKEPVPFASISISNSTRGTAANGKGEFDLMIRPSDFKESLKISSIGFISQTVSIETSRNIEQVVVELQSDIKLLKEVEISQKPISPIEIIKAAIDSVSKNYRTGPFNLEFYSEMTASNFLTNQEFKVESILLGYYEGYANNTAKKFEILKKRADGDNPLKAMEYPFWPTLEIHRADLIADPYKTGVLNVEYLDRFEYRYLGILTYDTDTVYRIEYSAPKPTKRITGYGIVPKTYNGTIYITTASNAIVQHDIVTDQFSYSIIYKKLGDNYYPYFISGERRLKGVNLFSKVYNIVRLTTIELENVKVIDYKTNEFENLSELQDDNEYWNLNYPVNKK